MSSPFNKIKRFIRSYTKNTKFRFLFNSKLGLYRHVPDDKYLVMEYKAVMGKELNLNAPKSFNEKMQWLKLYDRNPEYPIMVDKAEVKDYVAKRIGAEHIIETVGVWDSFDAIDFDRLPERFVLKCTHDSGGLVICKDKGSFDKEKARKKLEKCLKNNYYYMSREWPYKSVKPRIIAEEYMEDPKLAELRDYKFFCFNGKPKCFKIDFDRFIEHRANYYDIEGTLLPFGESNVLPDFERDIAMPQKLDEMLRLAEILSENIPFVRVDFYEVGEKIYFGELTFYPASGLGPFTDEEWDMKLGSWIELPEKSEEQK